MIKKINIETPIWSSKSVGINVEDCDASTMIEIDIIYKNKKGERVYPNTYSIIANEVVKYPISSAIKRVPVHIVPINKLTTK